MICYVKYWGKADQASKQWHPLVCHMLDVAAVARVTIESMPEFLSGWSERLGLEPEWLLDLVCFLAAIHDLGKFTPEFQCKIPELAQLLQNGSEPLIVGYPHTSVAWLLWNKKLEGQVFSRYEIEDEQSINLGNTLEPLLSASFGHHGGPVRGPSIRSKSTIRRVFGDDAVSACSILLDNLIDLFGGVHHIFLQPNVLVSHRSDINIFSFILSGLIILSDWTASASSNFPFLVPANEGQFSDQIEPYNMKGYFTKAQVLAKSAIERQGITPVPKKPIENLWKDLFPNLYEAKHEPSPLQEMMIHLKPENEPGLYVIEDLAGAGKTEAALILFSKLQNVGAVDGFYFALPTMATSNGMYRRLKQVHRKFFADEGIPSLILAHGGSKLHQDFQKSVVPDVHSIPEESNNTGKGLSDSQEIEYSASKSACSEWIADRSRKVFLAQVGVGSVDQAMLSVLYSKHNTLRMFGLSRKVLIIDEVHAYDLYMQRILNNLLEFMATQQKSVILLSATLPLSMKKELANAYRKGFHLDDNPYPTYSDGNDSFPLITIYHKSKSIHIPVEARLGNRRSVSLSFFSSPHIDEPLEFLKEVSLTGRCGVWIRNTVHDVQVAYAALVGEIGAENVLMFHSRFTMQDRQIHENRVLETYGKESGESIRKGKVLIATQVVEQSLDLDFDEMVTDLCPIDLVVQRAGRLKRHSRDPRGNPIAGEKDNRDAPLLHIYGPNPEGTITSEWYSDFFPGGSFVYKDPGILWRTAKILYEERALVVPDKSRYLVESVYGDIAEKIPESLRDLSGRACQRDMHSEAVADSNIFPLSDGFVQPSDAKPWPDSSAPTRLSDDVTTFRLCVYENDRLVPLAKDKKFPWQMCEVKYRKTAIEHDAETTCSINDIEKTLFDGGRGGVLLPMVGEYLKHSQNETYRSMGCTSDGRSFIYDTIHGLRLVTT